MKRAEVEVGARVRLRPKDHSLVRTPVGAVLTGVVQGPPETITGRHYVVPVLFDGATAPRAIPLHRLEPILDLPPWPRSAAAST